MPPLPVRSSRVAYANPWLSVREDEYERPDGTVGTWGIVDRPDFALVMPWDGEAFWLVEQWRHTISGVSLEFPAGGWPPGLAASQRGDADALARTELREETGFTAGRLVPLGHLWNAVGMSSQGFDVFLALDLAPGPPAPEPDEIDLRTVRLTRPELDAAIASSRIRDSSSLAALALLDRVPKGSGSAGAVVGA